MTVSYIFIRSSDISKDTNDYVSRNSGIHDSKLLPNKECKLNLDPQIAILCHKMNFIFIVHKMDLLNIKLLYRMHCQFTGRNKSSKYALLLHRTIYAIPMPQHLIIRHNTLKCTTLRHANKLVLLDKVKVLKNLNPYFINKLPKMLINIVHYHLSASLLEIDILNL